MTAWALLLEYDGGPFHGWQSQGEGAAIQDVLEAAARQLNGGHSVASTVAGRTDAGVHAAGQVAGLMLPDRLDARAVRDGLNFHMKPHPVVALRAAAVPPSWSARFSALRRHYRYTMLDRPARPALQAGKVWHVRRRLDAAAMHAAGQLLLGRHDFSSFRAAACQASSPLRTLDRLDIWREGDRVIVAATARSFLHHQVRNMVGTLKLVGDGSWTIADVAAALAARDRAAAGPTAPAAGLCLTAVDYEVDPFTD
jgi:tRNA pseudouridine38-40 synthase